MKREGDAHCFAHEAMRTRFELVIEDDMDSAAARAVAEETFAEIDRVESLLSAFAPEADIFRINAAGSAGVSVDPRVMDFLARASNLVGETGGLFDPTVGPVMQLLRTGEPTVEALAAAQQCVGFQRQVIIDTDAGRVCLREKGARLDPGALGKGYALDRALMLLRELEVSRALLHAGTSSVLALGAPGTLDAWRIAVAAPPGAGSRDDDADQAADHVAVAHLRDTSLSVSAPHGRALVWPSGRVGHVVNPKSGEPAEGAQLAAVIAHDGATAEAWSTALLCTGTEGLHGLGDLHADASGLVLTPEGRCHTIGRGFHVTARYADVHETGRS